MLPVLGGGPLRLLKGQSLLQVRFPPPLVAYRHRAHRFGAAAGSPLPLSLLADLLLRFPPPIYIRALSGAPRFGSLSSIPPREAAPPSLWTGPSSEGLRVLPRRPFHAFHAIVRPPAPSGPVWRVRFSRIHSGSSFFSIFFWLRSIAPLSICTSPPGYMS